MDYIEKQWIDNIQFPITSWSVFRRPIRTNNDVEGYHHKLNNASNNTSLNLYQLIATLHEEAQEVQQSCNLVEDGLLTKLQRKKYVNLHAKIHDAWNNFEIKGTISTQILLEICAKLNYGPIVK